MDIILRQKNVHNSREILAFEILERQIFCFCLLIHLPWVQELLEDTVAQLIITGITDKIGARHRPLPQDALQFVTSVLEETRFRLLRTETASEFCQCLCNFPGRWRYFLLRGNDDSSKERSQIIGNLGGNERPAFLDIRKRNIAFDIGTNGRDGNTGDSLQEDKGKAEDIGCR